MKKKIKQQQQNHLIEVRQGKPKGEKKTSQEKTQK